jgi:hypothetical protein
MNERTYHETCVIDAVAILRARINKAYEMALREMGIYADAELKDLPESLVAFRNIIDVLQGKGE